MGLMLIWPLSFLLFRKGMRIVQFFCAKKLKKCTKYKVKWNLSHAFPLRRNVHFDALNPEKAQMLSENWTPFGHLKSLDPEKVKD